MEELLCNSCMLCNSGMSEVEMRKRVLQAGSKCMGHVRAHAHNLLVIHTHIYIYIYIIIHNGMQARAAFVCRPTPNDLTSGTRIHHASHDSDSEYVSMH